MFCQGRSSLEPAGEALEGSLATSRSRDEEPETRYRIRGQHFVFTVKIIAGIYWQLVGPGNVSCILRTTLITKPYAKYLGTSVSKHSYSAGCLYYKWPPSLFNSPTPRRLDSIPTLLPRLSASQLRSTYVLRTGRESGVRGHWGDKTEMVATYMYAEAIGKPAQVKNSHTAPTWKGTRPRLSCRQRF